MVRSLLIVSLLLISGCKDPVTMLTEEDRAKAKGEEVPQNTAPNMPQASPNTGEIDPVIVDKAAAMQGNPNLVVVGNQRMLNSSDPFSLMGEAYVSIPAKAKMLNFKHEMQLQKELNGGNAPTLDQFKAKMAEQGVTLRPHKPWEMYGYDSQNMDIVLLEDPAKKQQMQQPQGHGQ